MTLSNAPNPILRGQRGFYVVDYGFVVFGICFALMMTFSVTYPEQRDYQTASVAIGS